ncbi:MAG: metallophosphoesterase family protein [Arcobacteraceae bacterium]|jgi:putative phosphoesterase|nr:YfcE family phosphodiesterase [Arcobacteraceae bacterium]MDY0365245.1 metallophosphoesterase family protein [Arcobacteraceae bacterium]
MSIKIGVISDSHLKLDYFSLVLSKLKEENVDYILHAGDICDKRALDLLSSLDIPYRVVFGNNDYHLIEESHNYNITKEPSYFKINNTTFKMMHLPYYMSADSDVVIFGHTHIFEHLYNGKTLYLNPGEVCARQKPKIEFVILYIDEKTYKICYHYYNKEDLSLYKKEIIYEK